MVKGYNRRARGLMERIKWMMMMTMVITVEVVLGVIAIYTPFPSIVMMITPSVTTIVTTMMMRCIVWVDAVDHNSRNDNSF